MKTSIVLISLLVGCIHCVLGLQIKISTPAQKTKWVTKSDVQVRWEAIDDNQKSVKTIDLDLMIGPGDGVLINNISFGVPAQQGFAEWIVDPALSSRDDYFVRITSTDDPNLRINGPRFTIKRNASKAFSKNDAARGSAGPSGWKVLLFTVAVFILNTIIQ